MPKPSTASLRALRKHIAKAGRAKVKPSDVVVIESANDDVQDAVGGECSGLGRWLGFYNSNSKRQIQIYYRLDWVENTKNLSSEGNGSCGPGQHLWVVCSSYGDNTVKLTKTGASYE